MFPDCSPDVGAGVGSAAEQEGTGAPLAGDVEAHAASPPAPTGRAATIGRLAAEVAALVAAGDVEGAGYVHETIGRLLARPAPCGEGATVVDLDAERQRRAGR